MNSWSLKSYLLCISSPTNRSGKTFVAAKFILQGLNKLRKGEEYAVRDRTAVLFLVPTCDLVSQQKKALKKWIGDYEVAEYFGGRAIPTSEFDVLISTPQAFLVCTPQWSPFYLPE